jgi:lysophospholipase L1-like esterase
VRHTPPPRHWVLLGDSLTQFGRWEEWLRGVPVLNRGVSGETSDDVLQRMDAAVNDPIAVFLLIGTNDLAWGYSTEHIAGNVRAILAEIERRAPGTPVVVQSVPPRTRPFREPIRALNQAYRDLVAAGGPHVEYLDIATALADEEGDLRAAFTPDGVHLSGAGYAAWVQVLWPHVQRMLARTSSGSANLPLQAG